jgi:hypothetical protein
MKNDAVFDAKTSREILKSIRYGIEIRINAAGPGSDTAQTETKLHQLRRAYLAKRGAIDERASGFGNVIFYHLLQEKYPALRYALTREGYLQSNLHEFKVAGKLPSLLTLLLSETVRQTSALERRYQDDPALSAWSAPLERLFRDALLLYPAWPVLASLLAAWSRAAASGKPVTLVSAICPDYSFVQVPGGHRYTFEAVGTSPGLAGGKFIRAVPAFASFFEAVGVPHEIAVYGGDFESLPRPDATEFIAKVRAQIACIVQVASAPGRPVTPSFFFDAAGGQAHWVRRHAALVEAIAAGQLGGTGLSAADMDDIFLSRQPLYRAWFEHADDAALRLIFIRQAAEYALMGEIYAGLHENAFVFGVDHARMAPFYAYSQPLPVLYRQTDYLAATQVSEEEASATDIAALATAQDSPDAAGSTAPTREIAAAVPTHEMIAAAPTREIAADAPTCEITAAVPVPCVLNVV